MAATATQDAYCGTACAPPQGPPASTGELPFTGAELGVFGAVGMALIVGGVALRQRLLRG